MRAFITLSCTLLLLAGCGSDGRRPGGRPGPGDGGADGGGADSAPDFDAGPRVGLAQINGTVWAPGNAPGMVPVGEEIPVFGALVRVLRDRPAAIPQNTYCEQCIETSGLATATDHQGRFVLSNITPAENYWVVIEKGQFRIERQITLVENEVITLDQTVTTLPSIHNSAAGDWVPRIAIATGNYDALEDVLGKMGLGSTDGSGAYTSGPGSEAIHFYANGGESFPGMMGELDSLVRDLGRMLQYHVIFIPCASDSNTSALQDQAVLRNLREFVAAGGKLYVTDWSGEWMDNVFPEHVQLGDGDDTPGSAYDRGSNSWNTSLFGDADGSLYDSHNAEVIDPDLFSWLDGQFGPTAEGAPETYSAAHFSVVDNWNTIENLPTVEVGVDMEGLTVFDTAVGYVIGGEDESTPKKPLTVTFEPAGCGRVLFSTYHTTPDSHVGLVPQERILLYLIMEIGVCKQGPILI